MVGIHIWTNPDEAASAASGTQALFFSVAYSRPGAAEKGNLCEMNTKQHPQASSSWQGKSRSAETATGSKAIKFGLIGSLIGTITMDLVMVIESLIIGEPVDGFVTLIGSVLGGGPLVGVVAHLLMGSLLGLLFGTAVCSVRFLNIESVRTSVWLGILAGLVTIPLGCIPFAIVAGVPISEMIGFSFVPHLVWGAVLGVIAGYAIYSDAN